MLFRSLISENQSGFVKNRAIADNILLTQELVQSLDVTTRGSNLILKLDMMKAYDRLEWGFLSQVLESFGFSSVWINLVLK